MPIANDKIFDKKEERECDPKAKQATCEVCCRFGMTNFRNNPEGRYTGHIYDIIAEYHGQDVRIETELKKEWGAGWSWPRKDTPDVPYKWDTMDFPYRKRDKGDVHAHVHDVVGIDMKRLFRVPRRIMLKAPTGEKYVRNRGCMEPFFRLPLPAPCSAFWHKVNGVWVLARKWDSDGNLVFKDGVKL